MIERKIIRVVRDGDGKLLMQWVLAAVAEICDECCDRIDPGAEMAVYDDIATGNGPGGTNRHITRTYCKACGDALEDSLIPTEAQ